VALADIIARIASDAATEADAIVLEAEQRASQIVTAAQAKAKRETAQTLDAASVESARAAETVVVKARLAARDALVARQRELIGEALAATAEALAALPDERYVPWLAGRIAAVARGGERLALGSADQSRATAIMQAVAAAAPDLQLEQAPQAAPFERGALLQGDRVRADLSLEAIVSDRKDELELVVARALFSEEA